MLAETVGNATFAPMTRSTYANYFDAIKNVMNGEGEKITKIGTALADRADETIDARGLLVIPGGIDVHTHLDMPFGGTQSADEFDTGYVATLLLGSAPVLR